MAMTFLEKYNQRVDQVNSLLCVGLDSDLAKIPDQFKSMEYPQFAFNQWIIDQTHQYVSAYKPNSAFYEARGDRGLHELRLTTAYLKEKYPTIALILDAKRADIGSTNEGYVTAIFDWLGFDAVTLHPYLGREALEPFFKRQDKACIILCKTSNPESGELQNLILNSGEKIWQKVAIKISQQWNQNGNCLLVVGATYPEEMKQVRELTGEMTFLVPGIGAQGGELSSVMKAGLNKEKKGLIINSARGIIFAPDPSVAAKQLRDEINQYRI